MAQFVKLNPKALQPLREVDARLVSYDVEMAEVTGGAVGPAFPVRGGGCTVLQRTHQYLR